MGTRNTRRASRLARRLLSSDLRGEISRSLGSANSARPWPNSYFDRVTGMETLTIPQLTEQMEWVLKRGDSSQASALGDQLYGALPDDPPVSLLRRAALHRSNGAENPWGDLPGGENDSEARLSTAWAILGLAQFSLHRMKDADTSMRRALSADPNNPFTLATMAAILHERRQDEKAIAVTRLLEGVPGAAPLVDEIREAARQRQFARELVERNAYLVPQRSASFSIWLWITILLVLAGITLLVFQPGSLLGYVLCVAAPLAFVLLLRKLHT